MASISINSGEGASINEVIVDGVVFISDNSEGSSFQLSGISTLSVSDTQDATTFQSKINELVENGVSSIELHGGDISIDQVITIPPQIKYFDGKGSTITLTAPVSGNGAVHFLGEAETLASLSDNFHDGQSVISTSSSLSLYKDDVITLVNETPGSLSTFGNGLYREGQAFTILSINGNEVTLNNPAKLYGYTNFYPHTNTVITKTKTIGRTIKNLTVDAGEECWGGILVENAALSTLKNLRGVNGTRQGVLLTSVHFCQIIDVSGDCRAPNTGYQYGVVFNGCCCNYAEIEESHGRRHALTGGQSFEPAITPTRDNYINAKNLTSDEYFALDIAHAAMLNNTVYCRYTTGVGLCGGENKIHIQYLDDCIGFGVFFATMQSTEYDLTIDRFNFSPSGPNTSGPPIQIGSNSSNQLSDKTSRGGEGRITIKQINAPNWNGGSSGIFQDFFRIRNRGFNGHWSLVLKFPDVNIPGSGRFIVDQHISGSRVSKIVLTEWDASATVQNPIVSAATKLTIAA